MCLCLQNRYMTKVVDISEIIEDTNTKYLQYNYWKRNFLELFNDSTVDTCLSFRSKISLLLA